MTSHPFRFNAINLPHRLAQRASSSFKEASPVPNLTARQITVLRAIRANPGATQTKIVEITGIDRSTLAEMISRMEGAGLVTRWSCETDSRAKSLYLGAAGRSALAKIINAERRAAQELYSHLSPKERSTFVGLMRKAVGEGARA